MGQPDSARTHEGFEVKLPKTMSALEEGRIALLEYLGPLDLGDRVINRVEVILEELVTNVVRHSAQATFVRVAARPCETGLTLEIEDDGAAFNLLEAAERDKFDELDDAPLGGLGIPLVKRLSQSVNYQRAGSCNRTTAVIAAP